MIIFKNKHYYSFLLEFKYVKIDFDLFQEAITFKTTKKFIRKLYSILFFKHIKLNSSFLIITCYHLLERF